MKEFELKYGCNPNQKPARIFMEDGGDLPIKILCGRPGYINFLDAFNGWQLVKELKAATGMAAATSFKHVSPTSAAVGKILPEKLKRACFATGVEGLDDSPLACAYARARGTDRQCSFGDFISLSDECDEVTARLIAREVSDGVIAPGYQGRNNFKIDGSLLNNVVTKNKTLPEEAKRDLIVSLITLKYTQSNSVCFAYDGQAIGVGAGQQSRIHCTRLAGGKADTWFLRQHEKVLSLPFLDTLGRPERDNVIDGYINKNEEDVCAEGNWQKYFKTRPEPFTAEEMRAYLDKVTGVSLGSDAFFPFGDNIERAKKSGVSYVAEPGGSIRDDLVIEACDKYNMVMAFTGMRLFHH